MSTTATTTLTVWSADRAALEAYRAPVAGPSVRFFLEAAVPTGMDLDAWDHDRATALWGCGRPELTVGELADLGDRPTTVFATLTAEHPGVAHAVTTCESGYASTAWFVRGRTIDEHEIELDLTTAELDDRDGEWDLPAGCSLGVARARALAG